MRENQVRPDIKLYTVVLLPSMWKRYAVHMPLQRTRSIPTANPGRGARAAVQIIGMICAMRCLLIGPKILEARAAIGKEKCRVGDVSRSKPWRLFVSHRWESAILPA